MSTYIVGQLLTDLYISAIEVQLELCPNCNPFRHSKSYLIKVEMVELNIKLSDLVWVFVYGTLKPGEANYKKYCAGKVVNVKRAFVQGKLFALPMGYPAMTLGDSQVYGYLLSFSNPRVLNELDVLENYQPTRQPSENLYNRQTIEVYEPQSTSLGWA
jgi:gamma-glutamylcyclotransferase (GGCT)/AIG2-like uncharacterized protein YtfP